MNEHILYEGNDISVLMSVYKNSKIDEVKMAIKSIWKDQTIIPKKILIVIDGLINNEMYTWLCELEKNNYIIKIIKLKNNVGLSKALSLAMKYVETPLIARMDSDDIAVSNRFEIQLNYFNDYPDLVIMGGVVSEFIYNTEISEGLRVVPEKHDDIIKFSKYRSPFNHPTVMFKTKDILKAGGYKPFGNLEDYYLWIRLINLKKGLFLNTSKVLGYMRSGGGLYERRGDFNYLLNVLRLKKFMLKAGNINIIEYIIGVFVNGNVALIHPKIRQYFYRFFLRKK